VGLIQSTKAPGVYAGASLIGITQIPHLRTTLKTLVASRLHWRAGPLRLGVWGLGVGVWGLEVGVWGLGFGFADPEGRGVCLWWATSKPKGLGG
jgi:hypothetical protein